MAPPKGKGKGRKAGPQEEYNGFCAPVSLLYDTFKSNVAASGGRVLPEQAAPVLAMLQKEPDDKLTQINIGDPIGPACVEQLCRTVQQIYFLGIRSVCFWNAQLGDAGCAHVCRAIVYMEALHKFEITDSGMGVMAATALADSLRTYRNKHLRIINVSRNADLGDAGVEALLRGVRLRKGIHELDVSFCALTPQSGPYFADLLRSAYTRIQAINLEGNNLLSTGTLELCRGLIGNPTIEFVNLANNSFDVENQDAIQALCEVMQHTPSLAEIDLDGNLLNDDSSALLLDAIKKAPHVSKLVISHLVPLKSAQLILDELGKRKPGRKGKKAAGGAKKGKKGGKKKKK